MKHPLVWTAALMLALVPVFAAAEIHPRPLGTDARIRHVAYSPHDVVEVVGTYGYQTAIEFAADEEVKVVTLGDTIAWQAVPFQNRLFLKPVEAQATTNLTVVTTQRTYYFHLRSGVRAAAATYVVRFRYPQAAAPSATSEFVRPIGAIQVAPEPPAKPINRRYDVAGPRESIQVQEVFDDGQFTYFRFAPGAELPAIYVVNGDGTEAMVNLRREGEHLVVERTARRFTLRVGAQVVCVRAQAGAA